MPDGIDRCSDEHDTASAARAVAFWRVLQRQSRLGAGIPQDSGRLGERTKTRCQTLPYCISRCLLPPAPIIHPRRPRPLFTLPAAPSYGGSVSTSPARWDRAEALVHLVHPPGNVTLPPVPVHNTHNTQQHMAHACCRTPAAAVPGRQPFSLRGASSSARADTHGRSIKTAWAKDRCAAIALRADRESASPPQPARVHTAPKRAETAAQGFLLARRCTAPGYHSCPGTSYTSAPASFSPHCPRAC